MCAPRPRSSRTSSARHASRSRATDESLRATANPIELEREESGGRALILSADVQAYALALTLAFVGLIVAAAAHCRRARRERLRAAHARLVRLCELVAEKIVFVAVVGGAIGVVLAVVFGLVVELGDVAGGEPWGRLPLVVLGLVLGARRSGRSACVIGALAREARAATLVAFLVALPIVLLGLVPSSVGAGGRRGQRGASVRARGEISSPRRSRMPIPRDTVRARDRVAGRPARPLRRPCPRRVRRLGVRASSKRGGEPGTVGSPRERTEGERA